MAIPDYQECMLPLLELAAKQPQLMMKDAVEELSRHFNLSDEERRQLLPSGSQRIITNRIGWAKTYLKKAGLLVSSRRGVVELSLEGKAVLAERPTRIDRSFLTQFASFQEFVGDCSLSSTAPHSIHVPFENDRESRETPEESMDRLYREYKESVMADLLEKLQICSFTFFEKLVVDLMVRLGYGGSREDAGLAMGKTGDEGIDGLIKEDRLGLELIYLQAKRWQKGNIVGRPDVQKFAGALLGKNAYKGVFITTSSFSNEALTYVKTISTKIILIDGRHLSDLIWESGLGLEETCAYKFKRVDSDYFIEI